MIGLVVLVVLIALAVFGVRKALGREPGGPTEGHTIRRFFQYLLLYGLLVVVATGLSGLLGRLLDQSALVAADDSELARSLAFTVVGVPLYAGVALWSRRRFAEDPREASSLGWAFYTTAATLTSLAVAMVALNDSLVWAFDIGPDNGRALARFIVWGAVWAAHWWLHLRLVPRDRSRVHHLAGSLIGLGTAATGLAGLLGGALEALFLDSGDLLADGDNTVLRGAIALVVGVPVWLLYWVRTAARSERDSLWFGYVLLAGIGGGLVTAVVSASTVLYDVLVWFFGDPRSADATTHFHDVPSAAAAAVVGVVVWWYHQAVLQEQRVSARTEVRRVYEYLMSAIGLLAAAAGLTMLLVAAIEAVTGSQAVIIGESAVNTLLASATLLAVGGPVWWFYWHRIQTAVQAAPVDEHASPTRRAYLFVLFGIGGVAAVVALLVGVYLLFEDIVQGTFAAETIRSMRFPIGILVTTGAIAGYHWAVYQGERKHVPAAARGPRFVLLVGPPDPDIARAVAHSTGGRVQAWGRTDDGAAPWSVDDVVAALAGTTEDEVLVLSDSAGLHTIPVHRS